MKSSELKRRIEQSGWIVKSQKGSHIKYYHPDAKHTIVFPDHGNNEVGKGLAAKLLKQIEIKK